MTVEEQQKTVIPEPQPNPDIENKRSPPSRRSRWFNLVLYPDNYIHMDVLAYLQTCSEVDFVWIQHEPDDEIDKPHIHVMIRFNSPRTAHGVAESFGTCMAVPTDEVGKNGKHKLRVLEKGEHIPEYAVEIPVLSMSCCHICNCPEAYIKYLPHWDFESIRLGKKKYEASDLHYHGDERIFLRLGMTESNDILALYSEIVSYANKAGSPTELVRLCLADDRSDLISFIAGHSYFVRNFLFRK